MDHADFISLASRIAKMKGLTANDAETVIQYETQRIMEENLDAELKDIFAPHFPSAAMLGPQRMGWER